MTKIPSEFIEPHYRQDERNSREIYINISNIQVFDVEKSAQQIWDKKEKKSIDEFEIVYRITIVMNNNYFVPIKNNMDEVTFQRFILWANKSLAFCNIKD